MLFAWLKNRPRKTLWLFLFLIFQTNHPALSAEDYTRPFEITVGSRPIAGFLPSNPDQAKFGKLEFMGGLELFSDNEHFGGYSGFRFVEGRSAFIAISDLGFWLTGKVLRKDGALSAIIDATAAPIKGSDGNLLPGKWSADAEGLDLTGDRAIITFERKHRVEFHNLDLKKFSGKVAPLKFDFRNLGLRGNKGLEAVVVVPPQVKLDAELVLFSERTLNQDGNIRSFLVDNEALTEFAVKRLGDFDITSAVFLPTGELVLLERRYNIASGAGLRMRKIDPSTIKKGALVDGEVLMQADTDYQIDNFEGLAASVDETGDTILTIVSDDNHFILQRTLLLEFKLLD